MEKGILLNDDGLKVTCIFEDNNITFEFDKNYEFLNNLLKVEKNDNLIFVYLGLKKILRIENNNIERILPVKQTDIKVLKALYESNNDLNSRTLLDYFSTVKNKVSKYTYSNKTTTRAFGIIPKVKTITHTYLTEILDSKELIRFLNEYDVRYPMNEYAQLDFSSSKAYSYDEIKYFGWADNLERALKVNLASSNSIERFDTAVTNREKLLKLACISLEEMLGESVEWKKIETDIKEASDDIVGQIKSLDEITQNKSKQEKKKFNKEKTKLNEKLNKLNKLKSSQSAKILYNELLNISLDKLTNSHVEYSTISFSNDSRLEFMSMKHKGDKRFNFLYNIDQSKAIKKYEDYARSLESLLKGGVVIGSDISGFESETTSLIEKLEWIIPVLHIHPNSVLRISAESFTDHTDKLYEVLDTIKEVSIRLNETCSDLFGSQWGIIPPPVIRIAHSLRLEENPELVRLIKEFNAVIEYSLSANKALRNIKDYSKISLGYYDKNKIKYVFSNDGGGMFYYKENEANDILINTKKEINNIINDVKPAVTKHPIVEEEKEEIVLEPVSSELNIPILSEKAKPLKLVPIEEEKMEVINNETQVIENSEVKLAVENTPNESNEPQNVVMPNNAFTPTNVVAPQHEEKPDLVLDLEEEMYEDEPLEEESELEKTLYDIFSDLKKDNKKYDSFSAALEEENELFTYEGKVLSETEKVNDELLKVRSYVSLHDLDVDKEYLEKKISTINSYNENSANSDYAKMYLFLLEREMFPDLNTSLKSIEYLYQNKGNAKNGIEKELERIFNLVIEQYDHDLDDTIVG